MPNYTAQEDIKDVLQIILAVLARPCINKGHAKSTINRATHVAYAELQSMKKRLEHALAVIDPDGISPEEMKRHNQSVTDAIAQNRQASTKDFPRPMSVLQCADCGKVGVSTGHQECQFPNDHG